MSNSIKGNRHVPHATVLMKISEQKIKQNKKRKKKELIFAHVEKYKILKAKSALFLMNSLQMT